MRSVEGGIIRAGGWMVRGGRKGRWGGVVVH